jgi:hypothetical protein
MPDLNGQFLQARSIDILTHNRLNLSRVAKEGRMPAPPGRGIAWLLARVNALENGELQDRAGSGDATVIVTRQYGL